MRFDQLNLIFGVVRYYLLISNFQLENCVCKQSLVYQTNSGRVLQGMGGGVKGPTDKFFRAGPKEVTIFEPLWKSSSSLKKFEATHPSGLAVDTRGSRAESEPLAITLRLVEISSWRRSTMKLFSLGLFW